MKSSAKLFIAVVCAWGISEGKSLLGELITFEVRGHVTNALSQDFQAGDTVVVDFSFDSAVTGNPVINNPLFDTQYGNIISWSLRSSMDITFRQLPMLFYLM